MRSARYWRSFALAAGGFVAGGAAVSLAWAHCMGSVYEVVVADYWTEQHTLAERAGRAGDSLAEAVHRWNAAASYSGEGFRAARELATGNLLHDALLPVNMFVLRWYMRGVEPEGLAKGQRLNEGIERAGLAIALEKLGLPAAAKEQWSRAVALNGMDEAALRRALEEPQPAAIPWFDELYDDHGHRSKF